MTFTNVSSRSIYFTCCHRSIPSGSYFTVPWSRVEKDVAVRSAMRNGDLAWRSGYGDPEIPGSPSLPDPAAGERRRSEIAARSRASAERTAKKAKEDEAAVKSNMGRMGRFDVPSVGERTRKVASVNRERPVTREDVIADGSKPLSLSDIKRHNKAVKAFSRRA